jgi:small-conductance mechanosensitive channel
MSEPWPLIVHYGSMGLKIAITMLLGIVLYTLIRQSLRLLVQTNRLSAPLHLPLQGLARAIVVITVLLVCLQQAGLQVTSLWAGLIAGAAMVAGGFVALSSVLSNVLCSVLLLVFAPFHMGDDIEIIEATGGQGLRGKVVNFNVMYTSIQHVTEDGSHESVVRLPNTMFFQKTIRRWRGTDTTALEAHLFTSASPDQG